MIYVSELSDDPGNDMYFNVYVVIQTEVPKPTLEKALDGIIAVVNPDDSPQQQIAAIAAELHKRGVTGVQLSPAEYVYVNN